MVLFDLESYSWRWPQDVCHPSAGGGRRDGTHDSPPEAFLPMLVTPAPLALYWQADGSVCGG